MTPDEYVRAVQAAVKMQGAEVEAACSALMLQTTSTARWTWTPEQWKAIVATACQFKEYRGTVAKHVADHAARELRQVATNAIRRARPLTPFARYA